MDKLISLAASPIAFILLISIVVTVHELGHYGAGRLFGAAVESFSIGFGRPVAEFKDRRGTRWRINWLPLGGFVKFVGELQAPTDTRDVVEGPIGRAFTDLGPLQRLVISLGGPAFNFVFAILVYAVMALSFGLPEAAEVQVVRVVPGEAAEAAGFKPGDVVLEAGGHKVHTSGDVKQATVLMAGEPVPYLVRRSGATLKLVATPIERSDADPVYKVVEKVGHIGLEMREAGLHARRLDPVSAIGYGLSATAETVNSTVTVLRRLVTGRDGLDKMSGPVGIFGLTDSVTGAHMKAPGVSFGGRMAGIALDIVRLAALFSIGVGFFNLLPIPVLDGGAAVMCIAEAVTGREIPERVQRIGLTIGLACLISFALVITWNDITRPGGPLEVFRRL